MLWVRVETQHALLAFPDGRRHAKGEGDDERARKNDKVLDRLVACLGT